MTPHNQMDTSDELRQLGSGLGLADAPCIIYLHEVATQRPVYVNPEAARALGYTNDELMQAAGNDLTLMHPDDRKRVQTHIENFRTAPDDKTFEISYRMRHRDGNWRWFLARDRIYRRDETGQARVILGAAIETTQTRELQADLREERARLSFVLAAARIGDWDLDVATGEARTSLRHDQCFGATTKFDAWNHDIFMSYVHPEDRARVSASYQRAVDSQGEWDFECRVVWPDESVHWIRAHGSHYLSQEGKPSHMLGIVQDITERKERELLLAATVKELDEQKTLLAEQTALTELALDTGDIGVWWMDFDEETVTYDIRCQRLFGFPPTLKLSEGVDNLHPDDRAEAQEGLNKAFDPAGNGLFRGEYRQRLLSGEYRWSLVTGITAFAGEGEERRAKLFTGTVQDIHERKTGELSLLELTQKLEDLVRERTQDVRVLAADLTLAEQAERQRLAKTLHDTVQQELYSVQFGMSILRKELEGRKAADLLETSLDNLKQTVQVTRSVTTDLQPQTLDEQDLAVALRFLAESMQHKHGLSVNVDGVQSFVIENQAMRSLLYNLANELLFNIVKHADTREATLLLDSKDDKLLLAVKDKGAGFTPDNLETDSGTGLGLSGAHKRLHLFGGELSIKSEPGVGTLVSVLLPLDSLG